MQNLLPSVATAAPPVKTRQNKGIAFALSGEASFTLHLPRGLRRDRPGPAAIVVARKESCAFETMESQSRQLVRSGWTVLACHASTLDADNLRRSIDEGFGFLERSQFVDASRIELWAADHAANKLTMPRQSSAYAA